MSQQIVLSQIWDGMLTNIAFRIRNYFWKIIYRKLMFFNKFLIKVANFFSEGSRKKYWFLVITVSIVFGIAVAI